MKPRLLRCFRQFVGLLTVCSVVTHLVMAESLSKTEKTAESDRAFSIPCFFSSGMLFQQNEAMNLWGKAKAGSEISAVLYLTGDGGYHPLEEVSTRTDSEGKWRFAFSPRAASYDSYCIEIECDGIGVRIFDDLLIGELWLATGQSNMEFVLANSVGGAEAMEMADDPWLRILLEPIEPSYGNQYPAEPAWDVPGSRWGRGDSGADIAFASAVAYWAVRQMRETLDIPVGFINAARGATSIQTWLSRESIEENKTVVSLLQKNGLYRTTEEFEQGKMDIYQMTAAFNAKIGPLAGMNIAGLMWYQGETNRDGKPNELGYYTEALSALIEGYSKIFGFENAADMPVLLSHLAAHPYLNDPFNLAYWVEDVTAACERYPNLMQLPLYDAPLIYRDPPAADYHPIHPSDKRLIGQRMGLAAVHNVYGVGQSGYDAPVFQSLRLEGNKAYVTFSNTGDGLVSRGTLADVHGFAVCNEERVFVPAKARIVSSDTVVVWNEGVLHPTAVTYAFASFNQSASLSNSFGLPAVPFRSDQEQSVYFTPNDWMDCDSLTEWYSDVSTAWERPCWNTADRTEGRHSLLVQYETNEETDFLTGISPQMNGNANLFRIRYTTLSVLVKNPDDREKELSLLLSGSDGQVFSAEASGAKVSFHTLGAKTGFTRYTFRLDRLADISVGEAADTSTLEINQLQITLRDTKAGSILMDEVTLGFEAAETVEYPFDYHYRYGDINMDGMVDAADALLDLQQSVNLIEMTADQVAVGDVNADARIDASDGLLILQRSVDLLGRFPAEQYTERVQMIHKRQQGGEPDANLSKRIQLFPGRPRKPFGLSFAGMQHAVPLVFEPGGDEGGRRMGDQRGGARG